MNVPFSERQFRRIQRIANYYHVTPAELVGRWTDARAVVEEICLFKAEWKDLSASDKDSCRQIMPPSNP